MFYQTTDNPAVRRALRADFHFSSRLRVIGLEIFGHTELSGDGGLTWSAITDEAWRGHAEISDEVLVDPATLAPSAGGEPAFSLLTRLTAAGLGLGPQTPVFIGLAGAIEQYLQRNWPAPDAP